MAIAVILILSAVPWVFSNKFRPLLGNENIFSISRIDQYFTNRPYLKDPYVGAANFVRSLSCSAIGLSLEAESWEYPLWPLLRTHDTRVVRLEHVNVANVSSVLSDRSPHSLFIPCAIISVGYGQGNGVRAVQLIVKGRRYDQEWAMKPVAVLLREDFRNHEVRPGRDDACLDRIRLATLDGGSARDHAAVLRAPRQRIPFRSVPQGPREGFHIGQRALDQFPSASSERVRFTGSRVYFQSGARPDKIRCEGSG